MQKSYKYYFSKFLARMFIIFGLVNKAKLKVLRGESILSIYFHKPSKEEFYSCIKWLKENDFVFISIKELEDIINQNKSFPKGGVLLTVDDGWHSNIKNIVEIAEMYKIPITIFASTEPIETGIFWWSYIIEAIKLKLTKYKVKDLKKLPNNTRLCVLSELTPKIKIPREALTIQQLKDISNSSFVTIGSHTLSHPILTNCSDKKVYEELKESQSKLANWLKRPIIYFAYPNGDYSKREIDILNELNYTMAFSTQASYITPGILNKRFELPRFEIRENVSNEENICRMVGVWQRFINNTKKILFLR